MLLREFCSRVQLVSGFVNHSDCDKQRAFPPSSAARCKAGSKPKVDVKTLQDASFSSASSHTIPSSCHASLTSQPTSRSAQLLLPCQEAEEATPNVKYPRTFPHGVLNAEWSNDRRFLRKLRKAANSLIASVRRGVVGRSLRVSRQAIRTGKPFVIKDFLFGPVAEAVSCRCQS